MAAWDEPELIGVERTQTIESEVSGGVGAGPKAFVALVLACLVGLFVLSGGRNAEDGDDNQEIAGEQDDENPETDSPVTTRETNPTTTERPSRSTTTERRIINEGSPLLSDETGWDLFIGSDYELLQVGLDDGGIQTYGRGQYPLGVVGDYLLLSNLNSDNVNYVPLADLGAKPGVIPGFGARTGNGPQGSLILGNEPNSFWLLNNDWESPAWTLWRFAPDLEKIREVPTPINFFGPNSPHPEIIGASSGGVFRFEGDRLEKVADGRLMSVSETHAVVEQCASPFDCETVWFDLETWEIDTQLRTPKVQNPYFLFLMTVSPRGDLAFVFDYENDGGSGVLWDLRTGEVKFEGFTEDGGAFSPDGRYAAGMLRSGNIAVIDTETGELAEFDPPGNSYWGRMAFVPSQ